LNAKQLTSIAIAILISFPWSIQAQEKPFQRGQWEWDPIACYKSISQLSSYYRGHLLPECFLVPVRICSQYLEAATCLEDASGKATTFVEQARAHLPPSLPMTSFWPDHYGRALGGISLPPPQNPACRDRPDAISEVCAFGELFQPTMDAFRAARLAGIETGFTSERRLELRKTDVWSEMDPINCLAVAVTLSSGYRHSIDLKCLIVAEQVCENDEDSEQCFLTHSAGMRAFVTSARPQLPTSDDADDNEWDEHLHDLNWLDQQIQEIEMCRSEVDPMLCKYVGFASVTLQTIRIANEISPQLADELVRR
jgi:hypothetical protein